MIFCQLTDTIYLYIIYQTRGVNFYCDLFQIIIVQLIWSNLLLLSRKIYEENTK